MGAGGTAKTEVLVLMKHDLQLRETEETGRQIGKTMQEGWVQCRQSQRVLGRVVSGDCFRP